MSDATAPIKMTDPLVDAINTLKPSPKVRSDAEQAIMRMAAFTLVGHATDFGRAMERIDAAAQEFQKGRLTDDGQAAVEEALWRIGANREKLLLITSLALGVPTVQPFKVKGGSLKTGVTLKVTWSKIESRLNQLAEQHEVAHELVGAFIDLYGHPAIVLRNEISHGKAPIRDAGAIAWLQLNLTENGNVVQTQQRYLWPQGMSDRKDIQAETLWDYAVGAIEDATQLLRRAAELLAKLIHDAAVLEPGQPIYQDLTTSEITIDTPRPPPVKTIPTEAGS